jgi:hypothetical protein
MRFHLKIFTLETVMQDDTVKRVFAIILAGALLAGIDSVRADSSEVAENVGCEEQCEAQDNQHVGLYFTQPNLALRQPITGEGLCITSNGNSVLSPF